jgi:FixJ family two-component response regulator
MLAPVFYVIDDDEGIRESLASLLESHGWTVIAHASAEDFLNSTRAKRPSCLILDVRMPDRDGFDLQSELKRLGEEHSIIFLTGPGTIPLSVKAMREGAVEFLTKPFTEEELLCAVELALKREQARWQVKEEETSLHGLYDKLTDREKQVFALVVSGRMNKVIAWELGIAEVTVKIHRARVMEKLQINNLADLVRIAAQLAISVPPPR